MAKDKDTSLSKEERKAARKAEKKASKGSSTTLDDAGVNGSSKHKAEKKDKKDKKKREVLAEKALNEINGDVGSSSDAEKPTTVVVKDKKSKSKKEKAESESASEDEDEEMEVAETTVTKTVKGRPVGALVPFAVPLADDKVGKKVFKSVKKAAAQRTLKRGVKEVVKALRKSPTSAPPSSGTKGNDLPLGIIILAADISPFDVISHIPVLCEDHNIPYLFVSSRAELGLAGGTKRPTSVVMVARDVAAAGKKGKDKKDKEGGSDEDWSEVYAGLAKTVLREGAGVKR